MSTYLEYPFYESEQIESHSYLLPALERATCQIPAPCRVIDLGCGNGDIVAGLTKSGWEAHGVDLSESGIAEAERKHGEIHFHRRGFDESLVADLGPSSFDAVISTEVIEHLYAPRDFCRTAIGLLKPGGLLVLSTPYHGYLKNCALAVTGKLDQHFDALKDCGHIKFWSHTTMQTLLGEAGFSKILFSGAGRVPMLWKSMIVTARKPTVARPKR